MSSLNRRRNPARAGEPSDDEHIMTRRPVTGRYQSWIDEQVQRAQADGYFDNLPGSGEPLPKGDPLEMLSDSWLAHHLLKESGFLPDWLEIRKEVEAERPAVVAALRAYRDRAAGLGTGDPDRPAILAELERRYLALAAEINQKIDQHNQRRPSDVPELVRFPEDVARRKR